MEIKKEVQKLIDIIKKYRYAVIVLLIGLGLMMIPESMTSTDRSTDINSDNSNEKIQDTSLEDKLSSVLSMVDGAGEVKVILTISAGEEIIYQENKELTDSENSTNKHSDTVTVTDSGRNQTGLIKQVNPVIYQGAIVVCNGADNPTVRWSIVDAVSRLTGLGADCISVLKMK